MDTLTDAELFAIAESMLGDMIAMMGDAHRVQGLMLDPDGGQSPLAHAKALRALISGRRR